MAYPDAPYRFETVDQVLALPAVRYSEKSLLPGVPGLYFVMRDREVVYIGEAWDSLKTRWRGHQHRAVCRSENLSIAFIACPDKAIRHVAEAFAIYYLQPTLNIQYKGRPQRYFDKH